MNLFSSFEPKAFLNLPLNWLSRVIVVLFIFSSFWSVRNQFSSFIKYSIKIFTLELTSVLKPFNYPGFNLILISIFLCIALNNSLGLLPYAFTSSSHLVFTISIGIPLWLGHIVYSIFNQFNHILAHLVPTGRPVALIPALVLIELLRNFMRPLALCVRLMANITAGHLILSLLGNYAADLPSYLYLTITVLIALIVLERAVRIIQAYVFSILRSLYVREVNRNNL